MGALVVLRTKSSPRMFGVWYLYQSVSWRARELEPILGLPMDALPANPTSLCSTGYRVLVAISQGEHPHFGNQALAVEGGK